MNKYKTDDIKCNITFSEFAKILRPYYGANDNQDSFVIKLFDNIIEDYVPEHKNNTKAQNKFMTYNPLVYENLSSDTIARYFKGNKISADTYKKMLPMLNKEKFINFMQHCNNRTDENDETLANAIKEIFPDSTVENYPEKYTELFYQIITRGASELKKKAGRKTEYHYPKETSADLMDLLESSIDEVALKISKSIKADELPPQPNITYEIKEKIRKNNNLRRNIQNDLIYFDVNDAFAKARENGGKPFDFIRKSVNRKYLKLKAANFSEEDIVKNMETYFASFLVENPESDVLRILVSYFIQMCEVFDAPTR